MDECANFSQRARWRRPSLELLEDRALPTGLTTSLHLADQLHLLKGDLTPAARVATDAATPSTIRAPAADASPANDLRLDADGSHRRQSDGSTDRLPKWADELPDGQLRGTFAGSVPTVRKGDQLGAPDNRDEEPHRGDIHAQGDDRDEQADDPKAAAREDSVRPSEAGFRHEPDQALIALTARTAGGIDNPSVVSPAAPVTWSAPFANATQPSDRLASLFAATMTPDGPPDTHRNTADEPNPLVAPPEVEPPTAVLFPAQILLQRAGNADEPLAATHTHPVDGWLPIDLRAVERGAEMLLKRLGRLGDEDLGLADAVRGAVCAVGVWAAYEFARSRRRRASARPLPDWLAGPWPEDRG